MNITRRFASLATQTINPQRWLAAAKRRAIRVEVVAIGLLLMPVILVMADHLPFIDVPSGAFYHDAVSAVWNAGITTGTTPTTFSPDDFVTRGQMAVFLHRGLGRLYGDSRARVNMTAGTTFDMAKLIVNPGLVSGGTGYVKLDGVVTVLSTTTSINGCPCILKIWIRKSVGALNEDTLSSLIRLYEVPVVPGQTNTLTTTTTSVTWVWEVPTGVAHTFYLQAELGHSSQMIPTNNAWGSLTAIYAPYGRVTETRE